MRGCGGGVEGPGGGEEEATEAGGGGFVGGAGGGRRQTCTADMVGVGRHGHGHTHTYVPRCRPLPPSLSALWPHVVPKALTWVGGGVASGS